MRFYKKNIFGFTLIELLVVIAIIGVLASVVLASINSARVKARDARRIADLGQVATALELYYDANGQYPPDAISCDTSAGPSGDIPPACSPGSNTTPGPGDFWAAGGFRLVSPTFISIPPSDPRNIRPYFYLYDPVQTGTHFGISCPSGNACAYIMSTLLESANHPRANPGCNQHYPPHNYCIANGGARFNLP